MASLQMDSQDRWKGTCTVGRSYSRAKQTAKYGARYIKSFFRANRYPTLVSFLPILTARTLIRFRFISTWFLLYLKLTTSLLETTDFEEIQDLPREMPTYEEYSRRELPRVFRAAIEVAVRNPQLRDQLDILIRECQEQVFSTFNAASGSITTRSASVTADTQAPMIEAAPFPATPLAIQQASISELSTEMSSELTPMTEPSPFPATPLAIQPVGTQELSPEMLSKPIDRSSWNQIGTLVRPLEQALGFQQESSTIPKTAESFFSPAIDPDWAGNDSQNAGMTVEQIDAIIAELPEGIDWNLGVFDYDISDLGWDNFGLRDTFVGPPVQEDGSTEAMQTADPQP
jgi:hypothetical protein